MEIRFFRAPRMIRTIVDFFFVYVICDSVSFLKDLKSEIFSKIVYFFFFQDF